MQIVLLRCSEQGRVCEDDRMNVEAILVEALDISRSTFSLEHEHHILGANCAHRNHQTVR